MGEHTFVGIKAEMLTPPSRFRVGMRLLLTITSFTIYFFLHFNNKTEKKLDRQKNGRKVFINVAKQQLFNTRRPHLQ